MPDRPLVNLSVSEFVQAVASLEQPVPAGASVAALTGAACAALLVLVCDVHARPASGVLEHPRRDAATLQLQLLRFVDDDATAYQAFLASERGSDSRHSAAVQVVSVPLDIARACSQVVATAHAIEIHVRGTTLLDVGAAADMAGAAARSALDIAEHNLDMVPHSDTKESLRVEITRLRPTAA